MTYILEIMGVDMLNYGLLPEHMREGMRSYIEIGRKPGSFLIAVLANDFVPQPDGPTTTTNSRSAMRKLTSISASTCPLRLL